jgi:subtilisin family serine protease
VDANFQQAYFANSGEGLDVTAPAVGIQSAYGPDSIVIGDGTSQAAAITSGVVAYGLSSGSTTTTGAANWLKRNALRLTLSPERGGGRHDPSPLSITARPRRKSSPKPVGVCMAYESFMPMSSIPTRLRRRE